MANNWAKIDLNYLTNPKIRAASRQHKLAPLVHLEAILYAAKHMTDGLADVEVILQNARAPQTALKACIDAGILIREGAGMVRVHDYEEHQTPASEIEATRAARSAAGRAGATARWAKRDGKRDGKSHSKSHANRNATAMHRREVEENISRKEEREKKGALAEVTQINLELSRVLTDATVPHTVTPEWEEDMGFLVTKYGEADVRAAIKHLAQDDFWSTTIISPARLIRNWATLTAQARRGKTPGPGSEPSTPLEEPEEYPPGLQNEQEKRLWTQTWRMYRARGMTAKDASLAASNELNLAPVIDMKERLA